MKILFATDGSTNAQQAAKFLSKIDFSTRYELIVATVSHDPTLSTNDYFAWAEEWREQDAKRVEGVQDEVVELIRGTSESVKRVHRIGSPQREILKIAKEEEADLIVIGAVGHSALRRLVLGSVSDHVATHADCSVLVVRPHELESDEPLQRIMVAYDGSKPAMRLIDEVGKYKFAKDAEFAITTVLHEYDYMAGDAIAESIYQRQSEWFEEQRADNVSVVAKLESQFPNVESVVQRSFSPSDALITAAEQQDSQLIMVGDAGHTFWDDLMVGATTKYVLRHAPCSVWISRHHRSAKNAVAENESETVEA